MRLINATTLQLEQFPNDDVPPYVILSHTWGRDECTFQEFLNYNSSHDEDSKNGISKIRGLCRWALKYGVQYAWADPVCIDKRSAIELTESINSMWKYYASASACCIYLHDVSPLTAVEDLGQYIQGSRWFMRAWTVQELIAPSVCSFLDCEWNMIGDRQSLQDLISQTTGIDGKFLEGPSAALSAPIATKMQWFAKRRSSRVEDQSYSMLGVFQVHMPLLYGEGDRAFLRLQEEILKRCSGDSSLFHWYWTPELDHSWQHIFAPSTDHFYANISDTWAVLCTDSPRWNELARKDTPNRTYLEGLGILGEKGNSPNHFEGKVLEDRTNTSDNQRVLGERDGVDIIVENSTEADEEEMREQEMEYLYQIRLARRQELADREARRQERSAARAAGDHQALAEIRARQAREREQVSNLQDLRAAHEQIKQRRERAVFMASHQETGSVSGSDLESIFSDEAGSMTSMSSAGLAQVHVAGIQHLARTLASVEELEGLCKLALKITSHRKVRRHMKGFLQEYGQRLGLEASNPLQLQAAKFVHELAGKVADEMLWPLQEQEDETQQTGVSDKTVLERYLYSLESRPGLNKEKSHAVESGEDSSEESDTSEISILFPNIERVKDFLLSSTSFESLLASLKAWLKFTEIEASGEDPIAVILRKISDEREEEASERECSEQDEPLKQDQPSKQDAGIQADPNWHTTEQNLFDPQTSETPKFYRVRNHNLLSSHFDPLSGLLDFWGLSFFWYDLLELLTPKFRRSHVRVRWRCSCGTVLWGDFPTDNIQALNELRTDIEQSFGYYGQGHITGLPHGRGGSRNHNGISASSQAGLTGSSATGIGQGQRPPAGNAEFVINVPPREQAVAGNGNQPEQAQLSKYFEVCINAGEHRIAHFELDISHVKNDGDLFELIWDKYSSTRGFGIRRLFLRPRDVHFVKFSLCRPTDFGAAIHEKPKEFPPIPEVQARRYHYLEPKTIMPAHVFPHYLHLARWNVWGEHRENLWLKRLPKKLNDSILAAEQLRDPSKHAPNSQTSAQPGLQDTQSEADKDFVYGWGVHILEGPNHAVLGFMLGVLMLITLVISVLVAGMAKTAEQAFGVGSYLVAVVGCVMAAVYFNLSDQG